MTTSSFKTFNCSICNKPVDLENAKIDDNGHAVHSDCYVLTVLTKRPAGPSSKPAS